LLVPVSLEAASTVHPLFPGAMCARSFHNGRDVCRLAFSTACMWRTGRGSRPLSGGDGPGTKTFIHTQGGAVRLAEVLDGRRPPGSEGRPLPAPPENASW